MSVSVNCCENLSFQKVWCNCHWGQKKPAEKQVVYTDRQEQIVILSTPHIEVPDLVLYTDIQNTDVAVFSLDSQGDVRFASLSGRNLFQSIDAAPAPAASAGLGPSVAAATGSPRGTDGDRVAGGSSAGSGGTGTSSSGNGGGGGGGGPAAPHSSFLSRVSRPAEHKSHPSIAAPEDVAGRALKDVLPEYMLRFLLPICKQTLQGNFLQLTVMWRGMTQLVRTYPVPDHKRRIVAGMLTISPFVTAFNADVNRFSLGSLGDAPLGVVGGAAVPTATVTTTSTESHPCSPGAPPSTMVIKRPSKPEVMVMV